MEGEVKTPGALAINDIPMTLMEAVNRAGGILATAIAAACMSSAKAAAHQSAGPDRTRQGPEPGPAEGRDIVRVTPRDDSKIFVMGEVTTPTVAVMRTAACR